MIRLSLAMLLLLAACGNDAAGNSTMNAEALDGPLPAGAPPIPKVPAAAPAPCPIPELLPPEGSGPFEQAFASSTAAFRQTAASIRDGFRRACGKDLRVRSQFTDLSEADAKRIALENWPDANVPMLETSQRPDGTWRLMLGGPFLASDGSVNVPTAAEVEEAIFCAVKGASEEEQAESGRCLVD
jgi:hypothetical protein